jgi:hypothetical protein
MMVGGVTQVRMLLVELLVVQRNLVDVVEEKE